MKTIFITGATGFLGRNLLKGISEKYKDSTIIALVRNLESGKKIGNFNCEIIEEDVCNPHYRYNIPKNSQLIHCAWDSLRNTDDLIHIEKYFQIHHDFLKNFIELGLENILVTGTCFEYGLSRGPVFSYSKTYPVSPYALAKDKLHKSLRTLQKKVFFNLIWTRIFYLYGKDQHRDCIYPQFLKALNENQEYFNMTSGDQVLDYIHVDLAVCQIISLLESKDGIFNICSGNPISVKNFLEKISSASNKKIKLNLGYYKQRENESSYIWGGDPLIGANSTFYQKNDF
jgi:nucleoside-diphosphate-sugar epimerase